MPVYRDDDPLVEREVVREPVEDRQVVREPVVEREVVREPVVEREVIREPVTRRRVVRRDAAGDADDGLAGYALVKYGFLLIITIVVLWFIARVILPLFT